MDLSPPDVHELAELPSVPWTMIAASAYRLKRRLSGEEAIAFDQLPQSEQLEWMAIAKHITAVLAGHVTYAMNPNLLTELEESWLNQETDIKGLI